MGHAYVGRLLLVFGKGQSKCTAFREIYEAHVPHFIGLLTWYTVYCRGSQPFSFHVLLQHFNRLAPSIFQQMDMCPFYISTDGYVPIKYFTTKCFIMIIHRYI